MPNPAPTDPWLGPTSPVSPSRPAIAIDVLKATRSAGGTGFSYQPLPNVRCTDVVWSLGAKAKVAVLRYAFDGVTQGVPQSVEEALSTASTGPGVIDVGDEIVVRATRPDGTRVPLFDGFPLAFGMVLDGDVEVAQVTCVGVEDRCRDQPVKGAKFRSAAKPDSAADDDQFASDLPAVCNPDGRANATAAGQDYDPSPDGSADQKHPCFLDAEVCRDRKIGRKWTLPMVARYLIFTNNAAEEFVSNPEGTDLDEVLVAPAPAAGDPDESGDVPAGSSATDLVVSDRPLTGRDWPNLLESLIRDRGFALAFDLTFDGGGNPATKLRVFQIYSGPVKDVWLPARGSTFDPEACNLGSADASRTLEPLVNEWAVDGALKRYEATLTLEPGFPSQASDSAGPSALDAFLKSNDGGAEQDAYRLFVFNEAGDGYYLPASTAQVTDVPTAALDDLFGAGNWAPRRRPTLGDLISTDGDNVPLKARLAISKDYVAPSGGPGLWDTTGTWQEVEGGYDLVADRLGIRINVRDPNGWSIGKSDDPNAPFPSGVVKVVECMGNPSAANPKFTLRLTVALDGDQVLRATAARRTTNLAPNTVRRTVDARDRYRLDTILGGSELNQHGGDKTQRDDTAAAQAEAEAMRGATENGLFAGRLTIPRFTMYYGIGDQVRQVVGRGLPFRLDGGGPDDAAAYPVVEEIHWRLDGEQTTTLQLVDEAAFAPRGRKRGRR